MYTRIVDGSLFRAPAHSTDLKLRKSALHDLCSTWMQICKALLLYNYTDKIFFAVITDFLQ